LAAQDVRFARTIERIQRIMVSELTKIAIIHLYVQAFTDEELIDFEIEMSSPSIIFEQEKLNLWKEKIGVAESIMNSKMLSQEWIYHNILELSDDEIEEERTKIAEDVKRMAELEQAAQKYSDHEFLLPIHPNPNIKKYSHILKKVKVIDPLDHKNLIEYLATCEGYGDEEAELEEAKMGRPKVGQKYGQDSHPRGRDPLGHKENMGSLTVSKQRNDKRKSPLALTKEVQALMASLKKPNKKVLMENQEATGSLLDENNILDLEN